MMKDNGYLAIALVIVVVIGLYVGYLTANHKETKDLSYCESPKAEDAGTAVIAPVEPEEEEPDVPAPGNETAEEDKADLELPDGKNKEVLLFWGEGCPHCVREKEFLTSLTEEHPGLNLSFYEVNSNESNLEYFLSLCKEHNAYCSQVPVTFIGNASFSGFKDYEGGESRYKGSSSLVGYKNIILNAILEDMR